MKKIIAAAALASVSATSALAADMPVKAPIYSKTPIAYNWTGFYAGVNAGGGIGRSATNVEAPRFGNAQAFDPTTNLSPSGAIAGIQVGYNWQLPNFFNMVVGVEADIQHSSQKTSACIVVCSDFNTVNLQQSIGTFGTVRGRIGLTTGPVLSYLTGGYAYGNVNTSGTQSNQSGAVAFSFSQTRDGFVLGGGVEASLGGNWRGKIEYLYLDFGTLSGAFVGSLGEPINLSTHVRDNVFRGGINYAFNGNSTYKAPVANWSGLYIGGNVGSLTSRNQSSYAVNPNFSDNGLPQTFQLVPDGYAGGGQIGYNWQSSAWVFGLEADLQAASSRDNNSCLAFCAVGTPLFFNFNQKTPYFGTVRGRLGYSVGSTLFYATAGLAYGQINSVVGEALGRGGVFQTQTTTFNHSQTGYAVGAGMESPLGLFGPSWTMKVEYLYVDLGRTTDSFADRVIPPSTDIFTTRMQEHVFRTGINYHINAPVVARY